MIDLNQPFIFGKDIMKFFPFTHRGAKRHLPSHTVNGRRAFLLSECQEALGPPTVGRGRHARTVTVMGSGEGLRAVIHSRGSRSFIQLVAVEEGIKDMATAAAASHINADAARMWCCGGSTNPGRKVSSTGRRRLFLCKTR
jgi:hypothetical protein